MIQKAFHAETRGRGENLCISSPNPLTNRVSKVPPILPHLVAANIRRANDACQRLARVWRDLVTMLHVLRLHYELRLRIEGDDVRVIPSGEVSFAMTASRQRRRADRHQ